MTIAHKFSDISRDEVIINFLHSLGFSSFKQIKLPADASFRRYERIITPTKTYILMDAPPEVEDVKPFIKIAEILHSLNLSAPQIIAKDIDNGLLLLEDFGDKKFNQLFEDQPKKQAELYRASVDVLLEIDRKNNQNYDVHKYTNEKLISESNLFIDWYLPLFEPSHESNLTALKIEFEGLLTEILYKLSSGNKNLVLRDYHADNLMWLPNRPSFKNVGLLDFQDALIGNPAYDLVSLLEDARRDVPAIIQAEMLNYFIQNSPYKSNSSGFTKDYYILGMQRNLKIIGIFSRLSKRDGKDKYLHLIPRVLGYLKNDLSNEKSLSDMKKFLQQFKTLKI